MDIKNDNIKNDIKGAGFRPGNFGNKRGRMAPVVKPKNFKKTMARLWKYFYGEQKILIIIFIFIIVSSLIALTIPYLIGKAIDSMTTKNGIVDFKMLEIVVVSLFTAYIIDGIINVYRGFMVAKVSQRIVKKLRKALFDKLQKLPISYFDSNSNGDIMSRLSNDIENVSTTLSQSTIQLMSGLITIVGALSMMISLSVPLTFASIITIPFVFTLTKTVSRKTKILFKSQQIELGKLNGNIEETISGIYVVKAFNHEDKVIQDFKEINNKLCEVGIKAQILSGIIMPLMNVINNLGFTAVASVGGILAVKDMISIGIIASFLSYSRQFTRPLNDLASIFNTLQSAVAGGERVFEILDENEEVEDVINAKDIKLPKGDVKFENVSFEYIKDLEILKNVSFHAKEGSNIALVGPTGAGKTTIVNLLARFYDVSYGKILIDGVDIREYKRNSLRECFGIVLQDTYLFSGTIMDNIRYGKLDATDKEVKRASIMANSDAFIKRMPKGYNSILSESGNNLSQGQKQLLAIARAILRDPAILILDEATSNVDTRTELKIQEAMLKLMEGRTCFIIAHRLSTIINSDRIMVIDKGGIVEEGNHKELLNKKGVYFNMLRGNLNNSVL